MTNGNGATFKGPWWVTVVERTGSLGIVVIMLIGAFFIVRDYTVDMRKTWGDIYIMIQAENKAAAEQRIRHDEILKALMDASASNQRLLETVAGTVSSRLDAMDKRIGMMESQQNP